jgi:glycosyltransferase involved in cell wall biosynthesis
MDLASGLHAGGLHVSVLTPKHASSWADRFSFREFDVHRPVRVFRTGWSVRGDRSASRYIKNFRQWIESNPISCDVVYCDGGPEETIAAVEAARTLSIPSLIRISGRGCGETDFFASTRIAKRCRAIARNADAIVVGGATEERRWLADGGDSDRTHRIPVGIGPSLDREATGRSALRQALSRINGDLYVPEMGSVVLSVERLRRDSGVMTLVNAAYGLSQKIDGLQYWFVGDGPSRDAVFARLKGDGLRQSIAMPGSFGLMDDIYCASDLMVHAGDEGFDNQVPAAISAGLPLVMANSKFAREFFGVTEQQVRERIIDHRQDALHCPEDLSAAAGTLIWWFDPARRRTLRLAIEQIVGHREAARRRAQQTRRVLQRTRSRSESIECYVRLFRRLVRRDTTASNVPKPTEPPR